MPVSYTHLDVYKRQACNIATQIIAQVASSQYGGQSISLTHLAPFVDVSRRKIRQSVEEEMRGLGISATQEQITEMVNKRLKEEISRGVQTIQYQVVTLMTTNGQAPFVTVFMYLNEARNRQEKEDLAMIIEETLLQRYQGCLLYTSLDALKADDNDYDLDTEDAEWNEFSAVGEWGDSEDAAYYELRLYRNEKFVTTIRPVKETHYDFSKYIDSAGSYRFEVRGLYNSSRKGEWQESDIFEVTAEKAAEIQTAAAYKQSGSGPAAGTWKNDAVGWWYCNTCLLYTSRCV